MTQQKSEFGDCSCGKPAMVKINDQPACQDHMIQILSGMGDLIRHMREELND